MAEDIQIFIQTELCLESESSSERWIGFKKVTCQLSNAIQLCIWFYSYSDTLINLSAI